MQPGFEFSNPPENAVSYAIIFHDIDVALDGRTEDGLHWIVWNIPVQAGGIQEGGLPEGSVVGRNVENRNAYLGPGAPAGLRYNHYVFELYALSELLSPPPASSRPDLLSAMDGKVVAKAAYVGRFRRST